MAELALRQCGYDQFPLYDVSADIGYLPKPNQAGNFADRYTWSLNERSMLNEPWFPDRDHGVLLLGNSLVWGEVRMLPKDKLGAQSRCRRQYSFVDMDNKFRQLFRTLPMAQ